MTTADTDRLAELVAQKHRCLEQLHWLGQRQLESIEGANLGFLLQLLAAKQKLLDDLHQVQRELVPFQDQNPDSRPWQSTERRAACAKQLAECDSLLRQIVQQELRSQEQLAAHRDEAAELLQLGAAASSVHGAYVQAHEPTLGQLDLSVEM
jgi:hypothetical protein